MTFRVGQEVVCVKQLYLVDGTPSPYAIINEIYHYAGDAGKPLGYRHIYLKEFPGLTFTKKAFRPIVKTDISILEEIARKVTQGKRVKIDA